jgi:uncharacterized membrane protein
MMAWEIALRVVLGVIGFALIFFVPGYLVMNKFYPKIKGLERTALVTGISISVAILLGLMMGLLGLFSVWMGFAAYTILITGILVAGRRGMGR